MNGQDAVEEKAGDDVNMKNKEEDAQMNQDETIEPKGKGQGEQEEEEEEQEEQEQEGKGGIKSTGMKRKLSSENQNEDNDDETTSSAINRDESAAKRAKDNNHNAIIPGKTDSEEKEQDAESQPENAQRTPTSVTTSVEEEDDGDETASGDDDDLVDLAASALEIQEDGPIRREPRTRKGKAKRLSGNEEIDEEEDDDEEDDEAASNSETSRTRKRSKKKKSKKKKRSSRDKKRGNKKHSMDELFAFLNSLCQEPVQKISDSSEKTDLLYLRDSLYVGPRSQSAPKKKQSSGQLPRRKFTRPCSPSHFINDTNDRGSLSRMQEKQEVPQTDLEARLKVLRPQYYFANPPDINDSGLNIKCSKLMQGQLPSRRNAMLNNPLSGIHHHTTLGALVSPIVQESPEEKWSSREIAIFESGMCVYGKRFHSISKMIKSKTTADVIEFYYVWKKTSNYKMWKKSFYATMQ